MTSSDHDLGLTSMVYTGPKDHLVTKAANGITISFNQKNHSPMYVLSMDIVSMIVAYLQFPPQYFQSQRFV